MTWTELHPLIQEAGRTSLAVGVLVLLVLLIRRPFARQFGAKAAYMLWAVPLVRFVMPPLPANWSLAGMLGFGTKPEAAQMPIMLTPRSSETVFVAAPEWAPIFAEAPVAAIPQTSLMASMSTQLPLILVSVWIAGVALWLGRSFYQQAVFRSLIAADSEPASDAILEEVKIIAAQLGLKRVPDVRASLLCSGPLVTGLSQPVVLLPMWFEDDYTRSEQRDALVHELTHLRRRDLWAFQIARIITATQWFNPLAHLALNAFRTDQESACDADVLAQDMISPAAYGRTLVKAARLARPSDRRIAAASLTLAHPIKERLIMMQHPTPSFRSRLTGTALAAVIGTAAIFTTASCMSAQADDGKDTRTFVFKSDQGGDDNRQMVLLSDPFAKLEPKLSAIGDMDFGDMHINLMDLDIEMADLDIEIAELMDSLGGLEGMEEMAGLGEMLSFDMTGEDGHNIFIMKMGETPEDFEVRIEEWAERFEERAEIFEERAEEWAERYEERMEGQSEAIERRTQAMTIRIERRAEAIADAHEAKAEAWIGKIEATFDDEFEAEMEAAGEAVESLAEQCEARSEDDPTPEIVSAVDALSGETYRALCVNGERDVLRATSLVDWVQGRSDLSDQEKTAFMDNRNQRKNIKITMGEFEHDQDGAHKPHVMIKRIHRSETRELDGGDEE